MPLLKESKKSTAGIAGVTLVLAILIAALIPITISTATKQWELRREAKELSIPPPPAAAPEATASAKHIIPVLVLNYFPIKDGRLDPDVTGMNDDLDSIRSKVDGLTVATVDALERGSVYHGYKNPDAASSLDYDILESKEFLYPIPKSAPSSKFADHITILNDINICDYVDNRGIKEVWVWMYHTADTVPIESNMAMGLVSEDFWNRGSYGDVSNSFQGNDLPICERTYTVYDYNYGRGVAMTLENHTHQIEAVLKYADNDHTLFWSKFVQPYESQTETNRCGWTHYPPNGRFDYDWYNEEYVWSDCEDWKPDGDGERKQVNCHTWAGTNCYDSGAAFKIWWMQNIPGEDNNLLFGDHEKLRNWWDFIGKFDQALQTGRRLTVPHSNDPTIRPGWPIQAASAGWLSPVVIGDINGNGTKETVFCKGSKLYVYQHDGILLWSKDAASGYPVLGDIDPDFVGKEIITQLNSSQIVAWHGDGSIVEGWPKDVGSPVGDSGPVIEDLDNDGNFEIIIPSNRLYAFDGSGNELWSQDVFALYFLGNPPPARSQYAAATADINGNGDKEVVLRFWRSSGYTTYIMALDGVTGRPALGWEEGPLTFPFSLPQRSLMALGDINRDGAHEIILASPREVGSPISTSKSNTFAISGDRTILEGWNPKTLPYEDCSLSNDTDSTHQIILSDLNNDATPEIVHLGYEGCVSAVDPITGTTIPGFKGSGLGTMGSYAAAGDINNDGNKEFVSNGRVGIRGDNKAGFTVSSYNTETSFMTRLKTVEFCDGICSEWETRDAAFADLDDDGKTEIIIPYSGWIYAFDSDETTGFLDWPQYRHDERHTGAYTPSEEPTCVPESLLPGDLDCDCDVDIVDIMKVAAIWNTEEGDEKYNPEYDLRAPYGRIDITDIMHIAAKWNTSCP